MSKREGIIKDLQTKDRLINLARCTVTCNQTSKMNLKIYTLNNTAVRQPRSAASLTPWRPSTIDFIAMKASSNGHSMGCFVNQSVDHVWVEFFRSSIARWSKKTHDWGPTKSSKSKPGLRTGNSGFPGSTSVFGLAERSTEATAAFSSKVTRRENNVRKMRHSESDQDWRCMTVRQASAMAALTMNRCQGKRWLK